MLQGQVETRFLYFQSEPVQAFQVVHAGRSRIASASGYLILTELPKKEIEFVLLLEGQSRYRIDMREADRGISIRKQDGNWRLWDLSRNQWIDPLVESRQGREEIDSAGASPFAKMLSKAAKDPSLLSNRRVGIFFSGGQVAAKSVDSMGSTHTRFAMRSEMVSQDSLTLIWKADYYVPEGAGVDTVRVAIWSAPKTDSTGDRTKSSSTCTAQLSDSAFLQLRTRMAAASDEDEMVLLARRVVRSHCMLVSQARRLSNLFLHEETRYRLFDALYGHVADPDEFRSLGSFLTDPIYQKRFRSLLER